MKLNPKVRARFLDLIAAGNTVKFACALIGVSQQAVYQRKDADSVFAAAWEEAKESGVQVLEQEAFRRAVHGTEKRVVSAGKDLGTELQHSDNLLMFLLKAMRPEKYRDQVNVELYIRQEAIKAGIDPDAAVAEAQAIVKEAKVK